MKIIGEIIGAEEGVETEVPEVEEGDITKIIGMTETVEEINKDIMIIGDKDKKILRVVAESSGTIMTIGTEGRMDKEAAEERNGRKEEVKVMGIEVEVVDGTHTSNTLPKVILQTHSIKIQTTTALRLWDIKPRIHRHHLSTLHTHSNTKGQPHLHDHNRHQMFANCVKALDTMIISASSLAIFCREHKKHSAKLDHITIPIRVKQNGRLGKMIMKTPMTSLFSKGGSSCR